MSIEIDDVKMEALLLKNGFNKKYRCHENSNYSRRRP